MYSRSALEASQRLFYGLDPEAVSRLVQDVLADELSVIDGGALERFEAEAAHLFGSRHAVAVCNGTAALHLTLFALDLRPGDEVIMPAYGYYAMALPVCMLGARPVFCDVRADDLTIDVDDAASMVTSRTRAIIVHQPYGCPADPVRLRQLADRHGLRLISDASHAQGALWDGKPLGFYYDYVCASLGKGKLISGGELGVVTARDDRCRDRMLLYGHVNRVPKAFLTEEYRHIANAVGVKYRPHAFALALALTQIQTYPERSRRLVQHIQAFEAGLARIPGCAPYSTPTAADRVYWRIPLRIDPQLDPADLVARLQERDGPVERAPGTLVPHHSAITEYYGIKPQRRFPVADQVAARTVRVHPFPLYIEGAVEELLAAFEEVFRS